MQKMWKISNIKRADFPQSLKEIADPPESLYYCGDIRLLKSPNICLAVVGARKYSEYGFQVCNMLLEGLKGYPVTIISGLALGIDGIAHEAALRFGLPTIAIPGSGLDPDIIYPRSHMYLAEEIQKEGGLLLSELEPTARASPWSFPMRNRIMAGLARAVLIIEGEKDSGTLITARLALEYNRDVLAVPGSIFSDMSDGPNSLVKRGAIPICSVLDLLTALGFVNDTDSPDSEKSKQQALLRYDDCSNEEKKIISLLKDSPTKSELYTRTNMPISKLHVVLSMLEIRGLIREECGQIILHEFVKDI